MGHLAGNKAIFVDSQISEIRGRVALRGSATSWVALLDCLRFFSRLPFVPLLTPVAMNLNAAVPAPPRDYAAFYNQAHPMTLQEITAVYDSFIGGAAHVAFDRACNGYENKAAFLLMGPQGHSFVVHRIKRFQTPWGQPASIFTNMPIGLVGDIAVTGVYRVAEMKEEWFETVQVRVDTVEAFEQWLATPNLPPHTTLGPYGDNQENTEVISTHKAVWIPPNLADLIIGGNYTVIELCQRLFPVVHATAEATVAYRPVLNFLRAAVTIVGVNIPVRVPYPPDIFDGLVVYEPLQRQRFEALQQDLPGRSVVIPHGPEGLGAVAAQIQTLTAVMHTKNLDDATRDQERQAKEAAAKSPAAFWGKSWTCSYVSAKWKQRNSCPRSGNN